MFLPENVRTIAIEGTDGAGKSFQVNRLRDLIRSWGYRLECPTSDRNRRIRALYRSMIDESTSRFPDARTSVLLGLADYADVIAGNSSPRASADSAPTIRLFDRYCYSALADGLALGIPWTLIEPLLDLFEAPDVVLFLTLDPRMALMRKGSSSVAEAGGPDFVSQHPDIGTAFVAYQQRVRDSFALLSERLSTHFVTIDAEGDPDAVTSRMVAALMTVDVTDNQC